MNVQTTPAHDGQTRDLFDNPLGTDGFEFVEFTSPEPERLKDLFEKMGFTATAKHRSKNVLRFRQGDINFILNMEPSGQAAAFRDVHGPSANAMAFRVRDAAAAYERALRLGARPPPRVGTISTERLRFHARLMKPFSCRLVRCLCTVASDDRLNRRPISSRLGA